MTTTLDNARILYRQLPCIVPGCEATPTCFCHYPTHTGIGGSKTKWDYRKGIPACHGHHEILDGRNGASDAKRAETARLRYIVGCEAVKLWERLEG